MRSSLPRADRRLLVAVAATLVLVAAGCGSDDSRGSEGTGSTSGTGDLTVVAGFYPLAYVAEEVGGDHVAVTNLTNPGTEAHDLELSPRAVGTVTDADLALHLSGFQPAVDDAISQSGTRSLDAADHVDLIAYEVFDLDAREDDHGDEGDEDDHGHDHDDEGDDHGHDHGPVDGALDPHFWLDPIRLAGLAQVVADELADLDPDNAADYQANADRFVAELGELDEDLAAGVETCQDRHLVTSHAAFGYFAHRYDFAAVPIAGLSPSHEPSAGTLASLADFLADHEITTVYFETLVDPAIATTLADEVGAETAVLDPVEGITDDSAGDDYPSAMRANLESVRTGQGCT